MALGNRKLFARLKIGLEALTTETHPLRGESRTVVFLAVDGRACGSLAVADPLKPSTPDAVRALQNDGIRIVMLTGDTRAAAESVARTLGIDEIEAEVLPDQKGKVIERLQGQGRVVAMAGDGINDAPALAQADVGIAMGTGTDVAMESAAVTLVKGDLRGIVRGRKLSKAAMRNIRQNLFFALIYNSVGVPLAAGSTLSLVWDFAQSHARGGGHDVQFRVRHQQRAAAAPAGAVGWTVVRCSLSVVRGHESPANQPVQLTRDNGQLTTDSSSRFSL